MTRPPVRPPASSVLPSSVTIEIGELLRTDSTMPTWLIRPMKSKNTTSPAFGFSVCQRPAFLKPSASVGVNDERGTSRTLPDSRMKQTQSAHHAWQGSPKCFEYFWQLEPFGASCTPS